MHQTYWRPWDEDCKDFWVRDMPPEAIERRFPFYHPGIWIPNSIFFLPMVSFAENAKKTAAWSEYAPRKVRIGGERSMAKGNIICFVT
jgi:predicted phosphoadenosine phosphosulfate sulfurtransferase